MNYLLAGFTALALTSASLSAQETTWKLDNVHSNVLFTVRHLVISEVAGKFNDFYVTFKASQSDFSDASIEAIVKTSSVDTDNENRDNHLRSNDFFNAQQFPEMKFRSTSMKKIGEQQYALTGDLTIRDVTKPVVLDAKYTGTVKDPWGNIKVGFKATTSVNRFDYGVKWNKAIETGGLVAGENIDITLLMELAQKK